MHRPTRPASLIHLSRTLTLSVPRYPQTALLNPLHRAAACCYGAWMLSEAGCVLIVCAAYALLKEGYH